MLDKNDIIKTRVKGVKEARYLFIFMGSEYVKKSVTEIGTILGIT